ncbi:hypothetical protein NPE20_15515 [Mucilaginibacter sp. JC4]|uniref:Uncharacterized protein n=1 Tax=Mucilaginibacter aquariorum TaxID=2967225 RepID=A0ABT1T445_9SPHI|nr:hypothetical protein [Mucilaginibacter aquariorum]
MDRWRKERFKIGVKVTVSLSLSETYSLCKWFDRLTMTQVYKGFK